ncbi:NGFI-A-binding protein homolog isoform X3 [Artemia franciscana]|uniref:NGFI-A binding protein n=1 Tax=Artemia franciscana TaxID=6661 RepID=A0AA88HDZ1_ARTSF|nr:hypothetical protein QYM36_018019 [Artemia franciscana]
MKPSDIKAKEKMDPRDLLQACLSTPRPGISTPRPQPGVTPEPAATRTGASPSSLASALGLGNEPYQVNSGRNSASTPITAQSGVLTTAAAAALAAFASTGVPAVFPTPQGNRIISRNLNGTLAVTAQPSNESELQLYRVLQRANLLSYYDTFISQGGDDVQQLCEAGEEEFLEIMALVGMASKPLHVRRLQKALHEWMSNPSLFQSPLFSSLPLSGFPLPISLSLGSNQINCPTQGSSSSRPQSAASGKNERNPSPQPSVRSSPPSPVLSIHGSGAPQSQGILGETISPSSAVASGLISAGQGSSQGSNFPQEVPGSPEPNQCVSEYPLSTSPNSGATPVLIESQIARLAASAEQLVQSLPGFDTRPVTTKKKFCKELEYISSLSEDDPRRMEEIRKYAAIYGRFDCKRRPEKPLTLHEVSVNEAAAQICCLVPALLTRRDELFPLARQVVRESGYQYSKGHSRSQAFGLKSEASSDGVSTRPAVKRSRVDAGDNFDEATIRRCQERLLQIDDELRILGDRSEELKVAQGCDQGSFSKAHVAAIQNQQQNLVSEQNEIMLQMKMSRKESKQNGNSSPNQQIGSPDTLESRLSSNDASPNPIGMNGVEETSDLSTRENKTEFKVNGTAEVYYPDRMQVLSSRGDNIIAVTNPALTYTTSTMMTQYSMEKHHQCPVPWTKQEPMSPK